MSGTSLDGVDVVVAEFWQERRRRRFRLLGHHHEEFPPMLRYRLLRAQEEPVSIGEVARLHWELARCYADAVHACCCSIGITPQQLDVVGVHGQTVWHEPAAAEGGVGLQLGNLPALAQWLGCPVVGDLRSADLAQGGHGAPLVPLFDYEFLRSPHEHVAAVNLGGMANVTVLPRGCSPAQVRAWDTGPGNVWIDAAMEQFFGLRYDPEGRTARAGRLLMPLWRALQGIEFVLAPPPKSTGREQFGRPHLRALLQQYVPAQVPAEDIVHTLTRFTAWSVAENLRRYAGSVERLIVSGGGACNGFLLELLQQELPGTVVMTSQEYGIPVLAKEALCFAYLAYRRMAQETGNLPQVTGARCAVRLGVVALP